MGRIVIHAGMPKTGSSSIQAWLRDDGAELHREHGVAPLRVVVRDERPRLRLNDDGRLANAGRAVALYDERPAERSEIAAALLSELDRHARSQGTVVISAERFADLFWRRDGEFAAQLDQLATMHEVAVAYYVRPQHTALEAAWKQWGFRRPERPSAYLDERARQLHYVETLAFVREVAPSVRFTVRPFRSDLLIEGDVVSDFAQTFLGIGIDRREREIRRNLGLPLALANALHGAPAGQFWESDAHEQVNPVLAQLRTFAEDLESPRSERLELSRLVLQQACHELFEPENRTLIADLGWATDAWVPGLPDDVRARIGSASFERLDELWCPEATESELALLRRALAHMLEAQRARANAG